MSVIDIELEKNKALLAAQFLQAYLECSDEIQAGIREMLKIVNDPDTDSDDRDMTLHTLADALFPNPHDGQLGMDLEESEKMGAAYSSETREVLEEMDREESQFALRVARAMEERGLSQEKLAELVGVGQPAISNMLKRRCRPQRATVKRIAEALDIDPKELWPAFID